MGEQTRPEILPLDRRDFLRLGGAAAPLATSYYDEFKKFGTDAEKKMTRAMYDAVAGQSGFSVLESAISSALTGKLAKNGRPMSTYAKTFAQDATMNFHNAVR